ncbi:hypothetical protein MMC31_007511, partial [Peltigera leucophlebia]|nr:hypothetical protein [Peltigera leucophlebia]
CRTGREPNCRLRHGSQNRTALDRATARVQMEDISLLLRHGADPNNKDLTGRTPVLHAVDSHHVPCLRLILEGGGHPNPTMPKGVFRSSPLTAAGFAGMPEMLKLLLDFEANPNACNPEGLTALHSVARTQNVDCALLLPEVGADLSSNGRTQPTTAITYNNHPVLQLFVNRCYQYITTLRLNAPRLLPVIAVESRDYSDKLSEVFEELIAIAKAEEAESRSIDSLMESGLFFPRGRRFIPSWRKPW